jgi:hypothetical protein
MRRYFLQRAVKLDARDFWLSWCAFTCSINRSLIHIDYLIGVRKWNSHKIDQVGWGCSHVKKISNRIRVIALGFCRRHGRLCSCAFCFVSVIAPGGQTVGF